MRKLMLKFSVYRTVFCKYTINHLYIQGYYKNIMDKTNFINVSSKTEGNIIQSCLLIYEKSQFLI